MGFGRWVDDVLLLAFAGYCRRMGFGRRGVDVLLLAFEGPVGVMVRGSRAVGPGLTNTFAGRVFGLMGRVSGLMGRVFGLIDRFSVSACRLGRIASVVDPDLATIFGGVWGFAPMVRIASVVEPDLATIFGGVCGYRSLWRNARLRRFSFITTSVLSSQLVDAGCGSTTVLDGA